MASCALVAATHALEAAYGAAAVGDSLEAWASDEERAAERAPQGADAQAARGDGGDEAVRRSLEKLHGQYQGTAPEAGGGGGEKVREVFVRTRARAFAPPRRPPSEWRCARRVECARPSDAPDAPAPRVCAAPQAGASGRTRQLRPPSALKRPVWRGAGAKVRRSAVRKGHRVGTNHERMTWSRRGQQRARSPVAPEGGRVRAARTRHANGAAWCRSRAVCELRNECRDAR